MILLRATAADDRTFKFSQTACVGGFRGRPHLAIPASIGPLYIGAHSFLNSGAKPIVNGFSFRSDDAKKNISASIPNMLYVLGINRTMMIHLRLRTTCNSPIPNNNFLLKIKSRFYFYNIHFIFKEITKTIFGQHGFHF